MKLTEVFTKRPDLRAKYREAKPEIQNIVKLIANMKRDMDKEDRKRVDEDGKSPEDYLMDSIEAALDEGFEYYLQGNVMKYLWRYRYKNGAEDLKKAEWYNRKLIELKEKK